MTVPDAKESSPVFDKTKFHIRHLSTLDVIDSVAAELGLELTDKEPIPALIKTHVPSETDNAQIKRELWENPTLQDRIDSTIVTPKPNLEGEPPCEPNIEPLLTTPSPKSSPPTGEEEVTTKTIPSPPKTPVIVTEAQEVETPEPLPEPPEAAIEETPVTDEHEKELEAEQPVRRSHEGRRLDPREPKIETLHNTPSPKSSPPKGEEEEQEGTGRQATQPSTNTPKVQTQPILKPTVTSEKPIAKKIQLKPTPVTKTPEMTEKTATKKRSKVSQSDAKRTERPVKAPKTPAKPTAKKREVAEEFKPPQVIGKRVLEPINTAPEVAELPDDEATDPRKEIGKRHILFAFILLVGYIAFDCHFALHVMPSYTLLVRLFIFALGFTYSASVAWRARGIHLIVASLMIILYVFHFNNNAPILSLVERFHSPHAMEKSE